MSLSYRVEKTYKENSITPNSIISQILAYKETSSDISVYTLIESYFIYKSQLDKEYEKLIQNALDKVNSSKYEIILKNLQIHNISEYDREIEFNISSDTPFKFNAQLRIKPRENKSSKDYDDVIPLNDDVDNRDCIIEFVDYEEDEATDLGVAKIFASLVNDLDLYYYLINRVYLQQPLSCKLKVNQETERKIESYVCAEPTFKIYINDGTYEFLELEVGYSGKIYINPDSPMKNDPIWILKNMYIDEKDFVKNVGNYPDITEYMNFDRGILAGKFKEIGYDKNDSYQLLCKTNSNERKNYYIRDNDGEYKEIEYKSYEALDENRTIFYFLDGSYLIIPNIELIEESHPRYKSGESAAKKFLRK